jgi:hypothetical protein
MNRTIVPTADRERFLTRARALRTHFQSRGCQYWVFEDAEITGAFVEFTEADDAKKLTEAKASAPTDSLELGGDVRPNLYREVTL